MDAKRIVKKSNLIDSSKVDKIEYDTYMLDRLAEDLYGIKDLSKYIEKIKLYFKL